MITSRNLFLIVAALAVWAISGPASAQSLANSEPIVLFQDGFENSPAGDRAVAVPPYSTLEIPGTMSLGSAFTLALHVDNREEPPDFTRIFSSYRGAGAVGADRLILDMDPRGTTIPGLRAIVNNVVTTTPAPPAGMNDPGWHHYALTYDHGQVTIYFNGAPVASGFAGGGPVEMTHNLHIGEDPHDGGGAANEQLIGYVDNVLVLGRALSESEIAALVTQSALDLITPEAGELGIFYDFEGDSGATVTDKFTTDGGQDGIVHRLVTVVQDAELARLGEGALRLRHPNALAGPAPGAEDPDVGQYASTSGFVQVLNVPVEGGPAAPYAGDHYLMIDRASSGGTPTLSALFDGGALIASTTRVDIEFHLWVSNSPDNGAVAGLSIGSTIDAATQLIWNGFGQGQFWRDLGWDFLGWRYYDGQWHGPGLALVPEEWNKIQIHWDGRNATGRVNEGDPMSLGRFGSPGNLIDRVFFSTLIGSSVYFLDEITVLATPFPELPAIATAGSEDPAGNGFVLEAEGTTSTGPDDDGVAHWRIEAAADSRAAYAAEIDAIYFEVPAGWTATATVRLESGSPEDAEITVVDQDSVWSLQLSSGQAGLPERGLYLRTAAGLQRLDSADMPVFPSAYNTYQMIFDPVADEERGAVRVYVNGFNITAQPITRDEVPAAESLMPQFRFGDSSSETGVASVTRWAEARFESGPHPAVRGPITPGVLWQVFADDFEEGTVGEPPNAPQVGSYAPTGSAALVTDTDQPPAQSGLQHVFFDRLTAARVDFMYPLFTSPATAANRDRIHAEAWIHPVVGLPQMMFHDGTGTIFYQVTLWEAADNYRITIYNGTSHIDTGLFHTPGQWTKLELDYLLGSDQLIVRTADGVGSARVPPRSTIQGVHFRSGMGGSEFYVDEVRAWLSAVPDPIDIETFDGSDPADSGFEFHTDAVPDVGTGQDEEEHWRISSGTGQHAFYALPLSSENLADPRGWTATARGKVLSQSATGDAQATVYDGESVWSIRLSIGGGALPPAGVYLLTTGGEVRLDIDQPVDPAEYNTYQILFDPMVVGSQGGARVYINGINVTPEPILRSEVPDGSGEPPRFVFGDALSPNSGPAETRWSEVRFQTGLHPALPVILFRDGFENSLVAGPPDTNDPEVGTYSHTSFFVEVMTGPFPDGPSGAFSGNNYLAIDRLASGGAPTLSALFDSPPFRAGDTGLQVEFYFWTPGSPNNIASIGLSRGVSPFNNTTHLLWNGIGRFSGWEDAGWDFTGWRFFDGQWNGPGLPVTPQEWNKIELEWTGTAARGRVNEGEWLDIAPFGTPDNIIDRLAFLTAVADTVYYIDEITVRSVRLAREVEAPVLAFAKVDDQLTLSWTVSGFVLQQSSDLSDPAGWTDVPDGQVSPVTVTLEQAQQFFRLVRR